MYVCACVRFYFYILCSSKIITVYAPVPLTTCATSSDRKSPYIHLVVPIGGPHDATTGPFYNELTDLKILTSTLSVNGYTMLYCTALHMYICTLCMYVYAYCMLLNLKRESQQLLLQMTQSTVNFLHPIFHIYFSIFICLSLLLFLFFYILPTPESPSVAGFPRLRMPSSLD